VFLFPLRLLPETCLILRRTNGDVIKDIYIGLYEKYTLLVFLSDFNETRISLIDFRKILRYKNSMKIHPAGTEVFHEDGRTDRMT